MQKIPWPRRNFAQFSTDNVELYKIYMAVELMTPAQCRSARKLLDWTPEDLARAAGVSVITVRSFEAAKPMDDLGAPLLMRRALEGAGVRFEGDGARLGGRTP